MAVENKTEEEVDVRDLIKDHIEKDERDWAWLQRKTGIPYPTIYSCFVQRLFKVSDDNLKKINEVLGTEF